MKAAHTCSDEVARALAAKTPVVALETTVVTHGLPHPEGVTTARSLEEVIRRAGATPATIGVIGGATIAELACAVRVHLSLGFDTGVLIANPIPVADEMPTELYDRAIETALSDAEANSIRGRALTPFLLDRMRVLTGGESVRANLALLRHNAEVAAALALAGV